MYVFGSRIVSHGQVSALALGMTVLMVISTSFCWNQGPTISCQFRPRVVGQFGAILSFNSLFPILIWGDSKQLDHVGRQSSSFSMITGSSDGPMVSVPQGLPFPTATALRVSHIHYMRLCLPEACSNRAQQSFFYPGLTMYLHSKHFYERKGNIHFKIFYKDCPLEMSR